MNLCPELRRFQAEHARWLAELAERGPGAEAGDAARFLALWEDEILPRCRRVEDVLLPELARRIPEADAVIVFTLGDHVVLRGLVRELRGAPEPGRREVAARFGKKLAEHVAFEERTLFPAVQEALGCDRLAALGCELTIRERNRPADGPPATREASRKKGKKPVLGQRRIHEADRARPVSQPGRPAATAPRAPSASGVRPAEPLARRDFLKAGLAAVCALSAGEAAASGAAKKGAAPMPTPSRSSGEANKPPRMPVLFVGHGNPMNAIEDNIWSRGFRDLARALPRPKAILAVSAHWYVDGTFTTANERPKTIHDFGGFPEALYRVQYPAPGDPDLATRVVELVGERRASVDSTWGLDHGTWSVLVHLRPTADVPVVQLSIDGRLAPAEHLAIGRELAPLRDEGVLVLGSGNLVHNLGHAFGAWHWGETRTPEWAREFDLGIARALEQRETDHLVRALESDSGRLSHPTPDHYLPLLYAAGASTQGDTIRFPIEGFDMASLSMRSVVFG